MRIDEPVLLIIDASPEEREKAQRVLEQSGLKVRVASAPPQTAVPAAAAEAEAVKDLERRVEQKTSELVALQRDHARAEKLAALGTLLAGVVHEIGSPLTVLQSGLSGFLEAGAEEQAERLEDLDQATGRISRLMDKLRRLSRVRDTHGWSQFQPALDESQAMLKPQLPSTVTLQWKIDPTVREVYLAHDDLTSVITNLVVNAIHALEGKTQGTIQVSLDRIGPRAVLSVSDDGCGIKAEHLARVLDPFFTTKKAGKGTGLGLSLVDQIIRTAGGSLAVESTLGVKTTVSAMLRVI